MTAVWVLLGKTRYPAAFYQTHDGRAWQTEIPFDLAMDFVPELLRSSDLSLQHLAARSPQEIAGFNRIIGNSRALRLTVGRAQKAAIRDVPVLILGETGTGKELFARDSRCQPPEERPVPGHQLCGRSARITGIRVVRTQERVLHGCCGGSRRGI